MDDRPLNLPPILPVGTQVVTRIEVRATGGLVVHPVGTFGVVTHSPSDAQHAYRVGFPDGLEHGFRRDELTVLSTLQDGAIQPTVARPELFEHVIYRCVIGSRAYGLDGDASDTDRRGIYLPPADVHWSLQGVPGQIENPHTEEVYWELEKFITLALKANPNILECLYTPIVEHATPLARRLLEMRSAFLSKLVYATYNGYVASQFKKLQADVRQRGVAKPKHLMHLIRLLLAGVTTLRDGVVPVHVGEHRDRLQAIRKGEMNFDEVEHWRQQLHREFDAAFEHTTLPDQPDYARANALLIDARRSRV